jgi:TonB-dependent SusC/RagA subfamily outer membrane receptor
MSLNQSRTSLARVAGILTCGLTFVALGGCAHRLPAVDEPSPAMQASGHDQRPNDGLGLRSFPGINVIRTPSGGFLMRIISGLVADGQPLYVIDDMPMPVDPSRGIDWFTPQDIVRIKVLKGPAETTVYGPGGANGVILITTKQGKRVWRREMPPLYREQRWERRTIFSQ